MEKRQIPAYATKIMEKLRGAGYDAFAVGGCVRDALLGRRPNDWDIATSAEWTETEALFRKTVLTGAKYGTVTVFAYGGKCEVTTFRKESGYEDSRRPKSVEFVTDIHADLSRRDFTVNAMAMSPEGEITDLFGGREDLEKKIIRCVGDADVRFGEDALRMFRAVRFSAQLGFDIVPATLEAVKRNAHLATALSAERVREETEKILLSKKPEIIADAVYMGLYDAFLPGIREVDARFIGTVPKIPSLRWSALCAVATEPNDSERFLKQMRLDRKTAKLASEGCALADRLPTDEPEIKLFVVDHGENTAMCAAAAAQARGQLGAVRKTAKVIREKEYVNVKKLALSGADLKHIGIEGKSVGEALAYLAREATAGKVKNEKKALLEAIKERY